MTHAPKSYLDGTGEFQDQLAFLDAEAERTGHFQAGSLLALHYNVMRNYYDYHQNEFANADVMLSDLVDELHALGEKGYLGSAPDYIQVAADDVITYHAEWDHVHFWSGRDADAEQRGDDVMSLAEHDREYPDPVVIEDALAALVDYVGLLSLPVESASTPLPNLKMAA